MNNNNISICYFRTFSNVMLSIAFLLSATCFQAQSEILNPGFEDGIDSLAYDWTLDNFGSGRTTDYAVAGSYSMSVWNWYYYAIGISVNGNVNNIMNPALQGGTPFVHKPVLIEGFYHYDTTNTFSDNDSAVVEVLLKKYNSTTQTIDSVAYGEVHLPATDLTQNFVHFTVPITDLMPGIDPDSIVIVLKSSINGFCEASLSGNCLYFYVDELSAPLPLGNSIPIFKEDNFNIWPNPFSDVLNINTSNEGRTNVKIINIYGQVVKNQIIKNQETINVEFLQPGAYIISIEQNGNKEFHKILK